MSNDDNTSQIATYLDSLESALDNGEPADVLAFLRVLRMNGLDGRQSAQLVESFSNDPQPADFERVRRWLDDQRQQLDSSPASVDTTERFDDVDLFGEDDFVSVDDEISELDELEADDAFVSLDEASDFEDIELNLDSSSPQHEETFEGIEFGDQSDEEPTARSADSDEINWGPSPDDGGDSEQSPDVQSDHGSFPPSEELNVDDLYDFDDPPSTEASDSTDSQQTEADDSELSPQEQPGSFPPSEEFQFDEPYGVDPTPVPTEPDSHSDSSQPASAESDSGPFGSMEDDFDDSFFGADSTPMPQSHRETGDESSAAIEQSLESNSSSTSTAEFKAPDDNREKTRQFDAAQLQALSDASSAAVSDGDSEAGLEAPDADFALGSSISSPLEDYGLESAEDEKSDDRDDPHQRRTRQQFKAPGQISDEANIAEPEPTPESDGTDDFDFDLGPDHSSGADDQQDSDDFDFDLGPDNSSGADDSKNSDDFDFGLGPDDSSETDDSPNSDDFDFDLGPDHSSGVGETGSDKFDNDPFGSAPDAAVEDMDYAAPPDDDDDSFFPPPIDGGEASSERDSTDTPSPFPESPSAAEAPTSPGTSDSGQAPLANESDQRSRQPTPRLQEVDAETIRQSQATPTRGTAPPPGGASDNTPTPPVTEESESPLPDDEFLALGEELSASNEHGVSPSSGSTSTPSSPSRSQSTPGYRGEPMVAPSSDETPAPQDSNSQPPTGVFEANESSGNEDTNPFAHEAPTGVRDEPMDAVEQSSFVLEEVDDQAEVEDPDAAIDATLREARTLYDNAEFEQAMELVEAVLEVDGESERARQLETQLQNELERLYVDQLGSLMHTPSLSVSMAEVANLDLDHRAGFLISQIDGLLTFEDILDMSSMSRLETLTVLAELYREDIISID